MKTILCIHPGVAYLPEIKAYKKYFSQFNIDFVDSQNDLKNNYKETNFDLLWYMMGFDFKSKEIPKVHDYASLSTGKSTYLKDKIKRYCNAKPELRLFLNHSIQNTYNFSDNVPFLIRDMGIDKVFFELHNTKKIYDFVYLGAISKERKIPQLFSEFKNNLKTKTLLVIGDVPNDIYNEFRNTQNITFTGKVDYYDVPKLLSSAEYGLNIIPNSFPFNIQTSTKLLEYCAVGLKVITTDYQWIQEFEIKHNASFFKLNDNFNFNLKALETFHYITPSVSEYEWNKLFDNINLFDNIEKLFQIKQSRSYK